MFTSFPASMAGMVAASFCTPAIHQEGGAGKVDFAPRVAFHLVTCNMEKLERLYPMGASVWYVI